MDYLIFLCPIAQAKKLRDRFDLLRRAGGEFPMLKGFATASARISGSVIAQNLWRVVVWINADAEQMRLAITGRVLPKRLLDLSEVAAHQRAVIRQRAARVNK